MNEIYNPKYKNVDNRKNLILANNPAIESIRSLAKKNLEYVIRANEDLASTCLDECTNCNYLSPRIVEIIETSRGISKKKDITCKF